MSDVENVKSRLNIADIVGAYVRLTPSGAHKKALCPFHNEKTPSFMVNEERQIFHCFGCGKGGDVITFIQEIEGLSFPEALKLLADKAGVALEGFNKQEFEKKNRAREALKTAVFFYEDLLRSPEGQSALEYLEERQVPAELIAKFQLGFAPNDWERLYDHLSQKEFTDKDMEQAGLVVESQKNPGRRYDRFRERIMFPIMNATGDPVGFSARLLPGADSPMGKYINTPQTPIYDKSRAIYGLHLAKTAIKQQDQVIFLEGNLDVIMSHAAGIENAVAACGTAVTAEQLRIVKRYTANIAFAFDADTAGQEAAQKGLDLALTLGLNAGAINLKNAEEPVKDVADLVKISKKAWVELSKDVRPALDYYFEAILPGYDLARPDQKSRAARQLLEKIALFSDQVSRDHYLEELSHRVGIKTETLYDLLNEITASREFRATATAALADSDSRPAAPAVSTASRPAEGLGAADKLISHLTALAVFYPATLTAEDKKRLKKAVKNSTAPAAPILKQVLAAEVTFKNPSQYLELIQDNELKTRAARLITIAENHFNSYNNNHSQSQFSARENLDFYLNKLESLSLKDGLTDIAQKIQAAEAAQDEKELSRLMKRYNELLKTTRRA